MKNISKHARNIAEIELEQLKYYLANPEQVSYFYLTDRITGAHEKYLTNDVNLYYALIRNYNINDEVRYRAIKIFARKVMRDGEVSHSVS